MNSTASGSAADTISLLSLEILESNIERTFSTECGAILLYCYKGSITATVSTGSFSLTPGWFLLAPADGQFTVQSAQGHFESYLLNLHIYRNGKMSDNQTSIAVCSQSPLQHRSSDTLIRFDVEENRILLTLTELANELVNQDTADRKMMDLLFSVLLIKLERAIQNHGRSTGFRYVAEAKQYIRSNLNTDISVQSVADHLGIHRSYLMSIFRSQTHMSVKKYINRMRITQATILLTDSNLSITEIAFQVGFNSRQNFYVSFEKAMGCSPSEYRVSQVADGSWQPDPPE